jgi:hypothetical protein
LGAAQAATAVMLPVPASSQSGGDESEEAVSARLVDAGAPVDEGSVWPDEAAEAAFLSEQRTNGGTVPISASIAASSTSEETLQVELPPLNTLVEQIPAEAREVLEDLFRARFVAVKHVPKSALKPAPAQS